MRESFYFYKYYFNGKKKLEGPFSTYDEAYNRRSYLIWECDDDDEIDLKSTSKVFIK